MHKITMMLYNVLFLIKFSRSDIYIPKVCKLTTHILELIKDNSIIIKCQCR